MTTSMNMNTPTPWVQICALNDIPPLGSRVLERPAGNVAIFRTATDSVFALLDHCPHKGGPLSQGIVHGESVTCPLHAWNIDLASGQARAPDEGCARRFAAKVENGQVFVSLS
ncbi:nitrite reductase (NADH) small subunit [Silvimonas terrae]|uniref:Nitrite reductase (NADH) small subunit n=1 Tax=Silvimonas terrae TaxID=300266 RepID=A0A840R9X5_9NEIS|nr:nitrite reductase small subunit NirD [Silvimonas terrae]MBB5190179.1 nitrite reductase (NADH) small subunit [Silvimonas terrae]